MTTKPLQGVRLFDSMEAAIRFLNDVMGIAKKHGARVVEIEGIRVEMGEPEAERGPLIPRAMTLEAAGEPEKCACGHDETTHDASGLCLLGCSEHVCRRTTTDDSGKRHET